LKMLMIVYRESIEEDIRGVLSKHQVKAFTEMHDVTGTGEAGAAFHSLSWPAYNNMILAALSEPQADTVVAALKAFRDQQVEKQGGAKIPLRVFSLPCELVL
jgi:nitrogen regulatory protein PII